MTRSMVFLGAAALCSLAGNSASAVSTVFFNASQVATPVASGVTSDTVSCEGYVFTYTRDKLFTGGVGLPDPIGRPVRVPWPSGVEAQAVTSGPNPGGARLTITRSDGSVFDITAFTNKLLANTAATGAAFEIMPKLNGEDAFNDPIYFDASGYYGSVFSYNTVPNYLGQSTARLKGFDTYTIGLFVDFALIGLTLDGPALPTYEWNGITSSWSDPANWHTEIPTSGSTAVFSHAGTATQTVDLGTANRTVAGLVFNDSVAGGNIIDSVTDPTRSLNLDNGVSDVFVDVTGVGHAINAPLSLASHAAVTVNFASEFAIGGNISESGGAKSLTKLGDGLLTLAASNAFTGGTTVDAGILRTGHINAIGGQTATATVGPAGTLEVANAGLNLATLNNHGSTNFSAGSSEIATIAANIDPMTSLPADGNLNVVAGATLRTGSINQLAVDNNGNVLVDGHDLNASVIAATTGIGSLHVAAAPAILSANSIRQAALTVDGTVTMAPRSDVAADDRGIVLGTLKPGPDPLAVPAMTTDLAGTLALGAAGVIDIKDTFMVINWAGTSPLAQIRTALQTGRNVAPGGVADGTWDGLTGIMSSAAATGNLDPDTLQFQTERFVIGYTENVAQFFGGVDSLTVGSTTVALGDQSVVLRMVRNGDLTMDGFVDFFDAAAMAGSYDDDHLNGPVYNFSQGDLNYDGYVDFFDAVTLGQFYDDDHLNPPVFANSAMQAAFMQGYEAGHSGGTNVVPEPGMLTLLGVGALGLIRRRRVQTGRERV